MVGVWPLVGRGEELAVIAGAISGGGEHRGVVVAGPAGVGKSRLVREAVGHAQAAGWAVRWVAGTTTGRAIPLGAFAQWTDGLDGNPLALVRQVIGAITAVVDDARVLVVVDDVHLLDDLSAFVLHQLVLQGEARVVATLRSGEAVPDAVRALWKDRLLQRLELQALSQPEVQELLSTVLGASVDSIVGQRMWDLSRGNPMFVRQLVDQELAAGRLSLSDRSWCWSGPLQVSPSLIDLVELQIGAIGDAVEEVVDLVALAEPLDWATLAAVADGDAIEDAERRGLVSGAGGADTVRVGHPLYGEIRLSRCGRQRRRRLHGRLATALTRPDAGAPVDPVRLGMLWLESDLPPNPEILLGGAQAAFLRMDLENAGRLAEAAIRAGAGIPAQLLYAHVLVLLIRSEEAEAVLADLTMTGLPDEVQSLYYFVRGSNLMWPKADLPAARRIVVAALETADGPLRHALWVALAVQLAVDACPDECAEVLSRVDQTALDSFAAVNLSWAATIALGDLGQVGAARVAAELGHEISSTCADAAYQGVGLTAFHVIALLLGGEIGEAVAAAAHTYDRCADVLGTPRWTATGAMGLANLGAGNLAAARTQLSETIADFERSGDTSGMIYWHSVYQVEALARSGHVGEAQAELSRLTASWHPSLRFLEADALLARAWVAAAAGRAGEARHIAARAAEFARDHHQWAREVLCLQTGTTFGDVTVAGRLRELAAMVEGPRAPLAARYATALAADDGNGLAAVSADFETMGDRLTAADAAAHAAVAFTGAGRRGSALTAAARSRRLAGDCGAVLQPALRMADLQVKVSGREREIVALVGQGLANKAIADALNMSVRTVEGHIYRACNRLGLSRAQLATLITDLSA